MIVSAQNAKQPMPRSFLIWAACGAVALSLGVVVLLQRSQSTIEDRIRVSQEPVQLMSKVLKTVETENGQFVKAWVEEPRYRTERVERHEQYRIGPTEEQQLRLRIIGAVATLLGLFFVAVLVIYFRCHYKGKKPPKAIEDWMKHFISGMIGAVLSFLGAPTGEKHEQLLNPLVSQTAPVSVEKAPK